MENIGEQTTAVGEQPIGENIDETNPPIIEKPKKPQKKRETQSLAQLETLKKGREKLAQKRAKQRDEKNQEPMNDMIKTFEKRYTEMLHNLEQRVHKPRVVPELDDTNTPLSHKIEKFFV